MFLDVKNKEGGCHCGKVRFKTKEDPYWVGACYCVDCRKISGSPYTVFAAYETGSIEILQGIPTNYSSSEKVFRSFCGECSSPFAYFYKDSPEKLFIPIGIFDDPQGFKLQAHIWTSQKLPWVVIHDDLPQKA
jgi:hypothetical protein